MSQTKPHPSVPPPPTKSDGEYFPRVFHVVIPDPPNSPAGQASACLYSEARLYKGARMAPFSQSTITRSTGNISMGEKKVGHCNTRGTVISLFFPAKLTAAQ